VPKRPPRAPRPEKPRRLKPRDTARFGLGAVMLFEATCCLLLAVRSLPPDWVALLLGLLLPALTYGTVRLLARRLGADAMLTMLMNFLCALGVILLYGLSPERGVRQAWMYLAGLFMYAFCFLAVRTLRDFRALCWLMIPAGLFLLVLPVLIGQETNGAKNWLAVPLVGSFQPSELVKLMLLLVLAQFFSGTGRLRGMLPGLAFVVGCLALLMLQKDLGTALIYYLVTLLLFWAASSNLLLTALGGLGGVGAAYLGYRMFAHVKTRVAIWLNPWSDAMGKGYQLVQALTAIASGGLFGVGLGMGQSRVIPAYSTDFIFAVLCEQFGILFGLCVLALYAVIVMRGIALSMRAQEKFHALLALGIALMIGLQTFTIIGGVVKLIPLTGITLPFVSYGGTSLVASMGMIGMHCGVAAQEGTG
jgi:cell division protein FtsW (lipid II flippase)